MSEPFVPGLDRDADLRATAAERDRAMRACEKMAARIAELEAERDAERRTIAALYIERDAALVEIARLREALAPFAEEADRYPPGSDWLGTKP